MVEKAWMYFSLGAMPSSTFGYKVEKTIVFMMLNTNENAIHPVAGRY